MRDRLEVSNQMAKDLIQKFGSPLYVYDEEILRNRCREIRQLIKHPNYVPDYSIKANTNVELMKIVREEGMTIDAMSPGEIVLGMAAGFQAEEILFLPNNISKEEMQFAIDKGILISVDSLSQLETYGQLNPGSKAAVRINPGVGAGHHQKVITGGKCKFGIQLESIPQIKEIAARYNLTIVGINQHIGSNFLHYEEYVQSFKNIMEIAKEFDSLEYVDFGGGLGVPYHGEERLDLESLSKELTALVTDFVNSYGNPSLRIKIEPGRYISAECGLLLGTVEAVKENYGETYIGTDLGFNVLQRPVMYDSYHEIRIYTDETRMEMAHVVGDICESGDIMGRSRMLPAAETGDIIGVENAGAYGYSMASNYNSRLRPAEVLIQKDGSVRMIRRRDTFEDLLRGYENPVTPDHTAGLL